MQKPVSVNQKTKIVRSNSNKKRIYQEIKKLIPKFSSNNFLYNGRKTQKVSCMIKSMIILQNSLILLQHICYVYYIALNIP